MAGFESGSSRDQKSDLCFMFCMLFQPGIQMYIDADNHGKEGIPLSGVDPHIIKMVIVEYPVIYPFAGSTSRFLYIPLYILAQGYKGGYPNPVWCRHSGHRGMENIFPCMGGHPFCRRQGGERYFRECFCLQYPQLTIWKPAMHRGVPSPSIEMESGTEFRCPRYVSRSIKGRMSHFWQSP